MRCCSLVKSAQHMPLLAQLKKMDQLRKLGSEIFGSD
jgi:hypothetical protein